MATPKKTAQARAIRTRTPARPSTGKAPTPSGKQLPSDAAALGQMINDYSIQQLAGNNKVIMKHASVLAQLRDITMRGVLIHKQLTHIGAKGQRSYTPAGGTAYSVEADGDIHFSLGTKENAPHVPCELQHGHNYLNTINGAIGRTVVVSGFFRCLFEHPGFDPAVDAHVCEIHPVRAIDLGNGTLTFDVAKPDAPAIHSWKSPHDLNAADGAVRVSYDAASDSLTFEHIQGLDTNYVLVSGSIKSIDLRPNSPEPAQFAFTSPDITAGPVDVFCLKGTGAAAELELLKDGVTIDLIGLRNIDLTQAMRNTFVINLLGIDIQTRP